MISRKNLNFKELFDFHSKDKKFPEGNLNSYENFFNEIDDFIEKFHQNQNTFMPPAANLLIDILQSDDLEDFSIYEDSGEAYSLVTGDYDLPDDGFEPLLLFNFYKVNNKNNKSIYVLELKDNCDGDYCSRQIVNKYFLNYTDAKDIIQEKIKQIR